MAIDQVVHAPQQKGLTPVVETGGAEAPAFTEHLHGHLVHQQADQHCDTPYQSHIITLIGMMQTAVQLFDSRTTELYPEAHGCLLLVGCLACVLERYTRVLMKASLEFPSHFLNKALVP